MHAGRVAEGAIIDDESIKYVCEEKHGKLAFLGKEIGLV